MRRLFLAITTTLFAFALLATCVYAEVPHLIRFQGKVTDKEGAPLNGAYNITFRIYDHQTEDTCKWEEAQEDIPVNNGIFTVLLGNKTDLDLPFDEDYWLTLEVNDDGEMTPRQRIASVGYAIHAETADSIADVELVPTGAIILWRDDDECPDGYSRVTEMDNKFLVSGPTYHPGTNDGSMGSNTHKHEAGEYKGPSHTHTVTKGPHSYTNSLTDYYLELSKGAGNSYSHYNLSTDITTSTSGTGSVIGTSALVDSRPEFATVILCEKE